MFKCPHCQENGITIWAKYWCGSGSPAKCQSCHGLSYVHFKYQHGFQSAWPTVFSWLTMGAIVFVFIQTNIAILLLALPLLWIGSNIWELSILPMSKIGEVEAKERNKFGNLFLLILIILGVSVAVSSNL